MMKDKLIKTGKGKPYYVMRMVLLVLGFVLLALLIFSIPVGISYGLYIRSVNLNAVAEQANKTAEIVSKSLPL